MILWQNTIIWIFSRILFRASDCKCHRSLGVRDNIIQLIRYKIQFGERQSNVCTHIILQNMINYSFESNKILTHSGDLTNCIQNTFRSQSAFICNYREHWFTIRKLGNQWFNLNSLLTGPELISDTYLSLFLTQLQTVRMQLIL